MQDSELRALVREVIAKQTRADASAGQPVETWHAQAQSSHVMLPLTRGGDGDGACLIEPAVRCNHCGYCLSYGH
jgi:hypothetical protein